MYSIMRDWTTFTKLAEIVPIPMGLEFFNGLAEINKEIIKGFDKKDLKKLRSTDYLPYFPDYCGDTSETF